MAECDDGPPPLEDMTEQLERARCDRKKLCSSAQPPKDTTATGRKPVASREEKKEITTKKATQGGNGFGGLRKGFLTSSSEPRQRDQKGKVQRSDSTSAKLPAAAEMTVDDVIRPKQQQNSKSSGLEFPEVQEAMKESFPFLNTQNWVTDDLLSKVEKDPVLSKAFQDPAMTQALAQFQANPQLALAATKDKPEIQKFLQSFCALMGEHFTEIGEANEKDGSRVGVSEIVPHEEAQMKEILAKPEVKRVLEDPAIRKLIEALKTDPLAAQQLFHSSSSDFKQKLRVLIDHGLLAVQQT